jgi:hypothetical protein
VLGGNELFQLFAGGGKGRSQAWNLARASGCPVRPGHPGGSPATAGGRPTGATRAFQPETSSPGPPDSPTVGTSGKSGERCSAAIARKRSLPALQRAGSGCAAQREAQIAGGHRGIELRGFEHHMLHGRRCAASRSTPRCTGLPTD